MALNILCMSQAWKLRNYTGYLIMGIFFLLGNEIREIRQLVVETNLCRVVNQTDMLQSHNTQHPHHVAFLLIIYWQFVCWRSHANVSGLARLHRSHINHLCLWRCRWEAKLTHTSSRVTVTFAPILSSAEHFPPTFPNTRQATQCCVLQWNHFVFRLLHFCQTVALLFTLWSSVFILVILLAVSC